MKRLKFSNAFKVKKDDDEINTPTNEFKCNRKRNLPEY